MFRKRKIKAGKNLRKRPKDDGEQNEEGDDDDDSKATGIAIRKTMKKQKILASLPLTSTGKMSKGSGTNGNKNGAGRSSSDQIPQRTPANAGQSSAAELSVMASKHVSNMEAFIEERMAATGTSNSASQGNTNNSATGTEENTRDTTNSITTEEDLYKQLAREVDPSSSDNNNSQQHQQQPQHDGDQGDGGAALLVGTGIAEVILPATNHSLVAAPTSSRVWNKNYNLLSSAVPEGERHKHTLPKTTPKPIVKFRKNNNTLPQNNDSNPNSSNHDDSNRNGLNNVQEQNPETSDTSRKGFDAFRGKVTASTMFNEGDNDNRNRNQNQNNRRKTGKDRDDQVYSHFLKNALNGKNRR